MKHTSLVKLLRKIHENEDGNVSIETILILGAIALPILAFLLVKGWPTIKQFFNQGLTDLENDASTAQQ